MKFIHPILIGIAILAGCYSGYLGWRYYLLRGKHGDASASLLKNHIRWEKRFYFILWLGALLGFGTVLYGEGRIFVTGIHAYLGILIILLFTVVFLMGLRMSKGKEAEPFVYARLVIFSGMFFLVMIQIVLGVILLTFE